MSCGCRIEDLVSHELQKNNDKIHAQRDKALEARLKSLQQVSNRRSMLAISIRDCVCMYIWTEELLQAISGSCEKRVEHLRTLLSERVEETKQIAEEGKSEAQRALETVESLKSQVTVMLPVLILDCRVSN